MGVEVYFACAKREDRTNSYSDTIKPLCSFVINDVLFRILSTISLYETKIEGELFLILSQT